MEKDVNLLRQPGRWLRSSHTFKECVIAHWSSGFAPKMNGAKIQYRSFGLIEKLNLSHKEKVNTNLTRKYCTKQYQDKTSYQKQACPAHRGPTTEWSQTLVQLERRNLYRTTEMLKQTKLRKKQVKGKL